MSIRMGAAQAIAALLMIGLSDTAFAAGPRGVRAEPGREARAPARQPGRELDRNAGRNVNRNINVNQNINRNVHVDVDHHDRWDDDWDHPIATAAAVTAAVAVTSAVVGSIVYSVPVGCVTTIVNGIAYQQCGSTWYQPQYYGTTVRYVVVVSPY